MITNLSSALSCFEPILNNLRYADRDKELKKSCTQNKLMA
jgi:hypothetical protein